MFKYMVYSIYLLVLISDMAQPGKLPKTWKTCAKGSPEMNECLKGAIEEAIHELADGNPSLGVLPMDPFHFDTITIDQGHGPVSIKLDYTDLDLTGVGDLIIKRVKTDWKEMHFDAEIPTKVVLDGKYKIDGKVLVLPINGEGHCRIEFTKFKSFAQLKLKEIEKGSKHFYEITNFEFDFDADGVHIQFDNLFNGDKALGDNMNVFLNENWKEILQELKPAVSAAFGAAFKEVGNRVFGKIPIQQISPS